MLMDIDMPVMKGTEASKEIRKISANIPIVAVSAYTASDDIDECFLSGMNDYRKYCQLIYIVSKPFQLHQLLNVLIRWLSD